MNEMIVAVFGTEDAAAKGLQTLKDLHREGGISLYSWTLIVRDGKRITVKEQSVDRPVGTALGLLTGAIVGILGGPAGSAIGAAMGGYIGMLADCARAGIDLNFLEDAGKKLDVAEAAVLAEIEENWVLVLEPRLREHGGTVLRRFRTDVVEEQLLRESTALQQELLVLEQELDKATAAKMEAYQTRIQAVRRQLETIQHQANAAIDLRKAETDLKVKALVGQAQTATVESRGRIEKRAADARADFELRSKKLNQAIALATEAITPKARPGIAR